MFIRDNHLHTHHSYDSDANFTDYLTHFDGEIVTTEHYDLSNPYTKQDDVPDYESYSHEVEKLNLKYGNRIKRGIEIGYYQPRESDILDFWMVRTMISNCFLFTIMGLMIILMMRWLIWTRLTLFKNIWISWSMLLVVWTQMFWPTLTMVSVF